MLFISWRKHYNVPDKIYSNKLKQDRKTKFLFLSNFVFKLIHKYCIKRVLYHYIIFLFEKRLNKKIIEINFNKNVLNNNKNELLLSLKSKFLLNKHIFENISKNKLTLIYFYFYMKTLFNIYKKVDFLIVKNLRFLKFLFKHKLIKRIFFIKKFILFIKNKFFNKKIYFTKLKMSSLYINKHVFSSNIIFKLYQLKYINKYKNALNSNIYIKSIFLSIFYKYLFQFFILYKDNHLMFKISKKSLYYLKKKINSVIKNYKHNNFYIFFFYNFIDFFSLKKDIICDEPYKLSFSKKSLSNEEEDNTFLSRSKNIFLFNTFFSKSFNSIISSYLFFYKNNNLKYNNFLNYNSFVNLTWKKNLLLKLKNDLYFFNNQISLLRYMHRKNLFQYLNTVLFYKDQWLVGPYLKVKVFRYVTKMCYKISNIFNKLSHFNVDFYMNMKKISFFYDSLKLRNELFFILGKKKYEKEFLLLNNTKWIINYYLKSYFNISYSEFYKSYNLLKKKFNLKIVKDLFLFLEFKIDIFIKKYFFFNVMLLEGLMINNCNFQREKKNYFFIGDVIKFKSKTFFFMNVLLLFLI